MRSLFILFPFSFFFCVIPAAASPFGDAVANFTNGSVNNEGPYDVYTHQNMFLRGQLEIPGYNSHIVMNRQDYIRSIDDAIIVSDFWLEDVPENVIILSLETTDLNKTYTPETNLLELRREACVEYTYVQEDDEDDSEGEDSGDGSTFSVASTSSMPRATGFYLSDDTGDEGDSESEEPSVSSICMKLDFSDHPPPVWTFREPMNASVAYYNNSYSPKAVVNTEKNNWTLSERYVFEGEYIEHFSKKGYVRKNGKGVKYITYYDADIWKTSNDTLFSRMDDSVVISTGNFNLPDLSVVAVYPYSYENESVDYDHIQVGYSPFKTFHPAFFFIALPILITYWVVKKSIGRLL